MRRGIVFAKQSDFVAAGIADIRWIFPRHAPMLLTFRLDMRLAVEFLTVCVQCRWSAVPADRAIQFPKISQLRNLSTTSSTNCLIPARSYTPSGRMDKTKDCRARPRRTLTGRRAKLKVKLVSAVSLAWLLPQQKLSEHDYRRGLAHRAGFALNVWRCV